MGVSEVFVIHVISLVVLEAERLFSLVFFLPILFGIFFVSWLTAVKKVSN